MRDVAVVDMHVNSLTKHPSLFPLFDLSFVRYSSVLFF